VPLSKDEQRALEEIERCLTSEDPGFAQRFRRRPRLRASVVLAAGAVAMVAGLGMITIGLVAPGPAQTVAAVVGFTLMVGSSWGGLTMLRRRLSRRRRPAR
jgi:hypothetical protein